MDDHEILLARAKQLAEVKNVTETKSQLKTIEFLLGDEHHSVESIYVDKVCGLKGLTALPCMPASVMGVIDSHGEVVPVMDLKRIFELPDTGIKNESDVIILQTDHSKFGIYTEKVIGMRSLSLDELQPTLATFTGVRAKYLKGITHDRVIVLDVLKLMQDTSWIGIREA